MPSSHLILCHPLLLLPPIPPSITVFSNESTLCMRWPKSWSFSFSIIPSKQIPELIPFRMDWLDLLAVQGTLKSLLQHHRNKTFLFKALRMVCCYCNSNKAKPLLTDKARTRDLNTIPGTTFARKLESKSSVLKKEFHSSETGSSSSENPSGN